MSAYRHDTKWKHGRTSFDHPPLDEFIGIADGFFPIRVTLDPQVGEEVVLYLRDQTPFIDQLRQVRPFNLMLKIGVARNEFGPLAFLVFWVPHPQAPKQPFAAYDVYLNPHSEIQVATWRKLAAQSHWHLFLVGAGGQQREFFEFPNTFGLDDALDFILEACGPIPLVDFNRAKAKFMNQYSVDDMLSDKM